MKKITLLIILLTTSISFGQNLIQDGTFDTQTGGITSSTTPWTGFNSQIRGAAATEDPSVGNLNNAEASTFQLVTVTPGDTYNFSFDYKWISGSGDYNLTVRIKDNLASGKPNLDITGGTSEDGYTLSTTTDIWFRDNTFSFTAPAGVTEIRVLFYKANGNRPLRIDNISLEKSSTASLEDLKAFNFSAYPNPASELLNISANNSIERIQVFNLIGQSVMDVKPNSEKTELNISNLHKGIYILNSTINGKTGAYKFIKE